jgi:hypothetical protein
MYYGKVFLGGGITMVSYFFLGLLSVLYIILCASCFAELARKADLKKIVRLPQYMLWIALLCCAVFLFFAWAAALQDGNTGPEILFCAFVLLGMSLMLGWKNCYIVFDSSGFTQRNLIGMQRCFTYDQVTGWCPNHNNPIESTVYAAGKKVSFNLLSPNGSDFLFALIAGYKKTHGKKLPEISALKKERGGFRSHVYNPGEYLAIFVMLSLFIVGLGAWLAIYELLPINEDDAQHFTLTFSSWEQNDGALILSSEQMQERFYVNGYLDHMSNIDGLMEKCNGEVYFSVWAERFTPDDEEPYFRVYALSSNEEIYRTFEDSTAYKRKDLPLTIGFFGLFLLIHLLFSGFIYAVGSNPEKFPKWVVYCCFKKDAIDLS